MTPPDPARYADGPLDPACRRAFNPDPPTRADWMRVSDGIVARVLPKSRPTIQWGRWVAGITLAASGLVAVLMWRYGATPPPKRVAPSLPDVAKVQPPPPPEPVDLLAEFAVLPIATDDEVRVATLRGDWGTGLVVGDLPAGELKLATADEVTVERVPAGMDAGPDYGDLPMVFGLRAKRTGE